MAVVFDEIRGSVEPGAEAEPKPGGGHEGPCGCKGAELSNTRRVLARLAERAARLRAD